MNYAKSTCRAGVMALAAGLASVASAQPNVTLSDVQSAAVYTGTDTSIVSYIIGSHTCNVGNQELAWVNNGTPGLAMNVYRVHDGRIMQLGLSFVKTACCAGDQNNSLCGTCGASGSGLGPGCLDVYGAGWNSSQARLGARSTINPYTRTFSSFSSATGDGNFKRAQVRKSDLLNTNFPNALYFFEGVYVASDETLAQVSNNASYKRFTVNQSTFAPTLQSPMVPFVPAIRAWRDHGLGLNVVDTGVTIGQMSVSNEGTYWYGFKVRDNNNGTWTYDYAVFNLNSHASGGSFSVPVPPGVTVTNIGFNAPDYHSGEPYSNSDWTATRNTNSVTWATQGFATNPNANALRWGTMYNFWFTATTPPGTANASLGLFRPNVPDSVSFSASAPTAPVPACDGVDFNNDNSNFDPQDIEAFLSVYAEGPCVPATASCNDIDFNNDNSLFDPCDISSFLTVYGEGPCSPCGQ